MASFCSGKTVSEIYLSRLERTPDRTAFVRPDPTHPGGLAITWREFHNDARWASLGLIELGIKPNDKIIILSGARYEFVVAEVAILGARGVTVPVDPLHSADSLGTILDDTGAIAIFVENAPQLERIASQLEGRNPAVIVFDASGGLPSHCPARAISWDKMRELGQARENREPGGGFERNLRSAAPLDPLTISLTAGTTGHPHSAVLTHHAVISAMEDLAEALKDEIVPDEELILSYLPFTHPLGRIETLGGFFFGWTHAFSEGPGRVDAALAEHRPTLMVSASRLLEKLYSRNQLQTSSVPIKSGRIGSIAKKATRRIAGRNGTKSAISEMGERLKVIFAVGGSLPAGIPEFCHSLGINVLEGYALAEVCGPIALNLPSACVHGTAGRPLGQISIRISEEGEIWVKSPRAGIGYQNDWLATGDLGHVDHLGYLHVKERRTDLIVTSDGAVVCPQEIESRARLDRFIRDFVVVGEDRRFLAALVTLRREEVLKFARDNDIMFSSYSDLIRTPQIRRQVQKTVDQINSEAPAPKSVLKFCLIPSEFSVEGGELTPSRRPKRRSIAQKYQEELLALYDERELVDSDDQPLSVKASSP